MTSGTDKAGVAFGVGSALGAAREAMCSTAEVRDERQFEQQVQRLLAPMVDLLPSVSAASVTYRRDNGAARTVAASSVHATMIDSLQYRAAEGPCLEAMETDPPEPLVLADLQDTNRWPQFAELVARVSVEELADRRPAFRSVVSWPVGLPEGHRASLNLYGHEAPAPDDERLSAARTAAQILAVGLGGLLHRRRADNLAAAVASNRQIGVALGILMVRYRWTHDQAFDALRATSQHSNRKLRDLADDITFTGSLPDADRL